MDGPVFDAMLKNALEEALRQDMKESPEIPAPSRHQRRRMRRLLAEPWSAGEPFCKTESCRRPRNPARYLAAVVVAALLTGVAAAGLALGGGQRFRAMFEENDWATDYYKDAANTEQLLTMGAGMDTTLVEAGGLRFEMLDAIFDGQKAMVELRLSVLDPDLLERLGEDNPSFGETEILLENEQSVGTWGYSSSLWTEAYPEDPFQEGQYSLVFSISDEMLNAGGSCGIRLQDLVLFRLGEEPETLLFGEWTLSITLRPTEVLRLQPNVVCRVNGVDWILDNVTLSPLALGLSFHREDEGGRYSRWTPCKNLSIRLKNGEILDLMGSSFIGSSNTSVDAQVEFLIPLDLEQADSLFVCGAEIPLQTS